MRKALLLLFALPALLSYALLVVLAYASLLLAFLLLGECEPAGPPEADPHACTDHSDELLIDAQGELCQRFLGQAKPVSGRFTTTGQLLIRQ